MSMAATEFTAAESALLTRYFTNLDRSVFALRNLPEVVKGALFSRYSRTEKSLRRVLLDEFINEPDSGFERLAGAEAGADAMVAVRRAEERYVRFDRPGPDGKYLYHRGPELAHPAYETACDALFQAYSRLIDPLTQSIRERFPMEDGETDRAWT